MRLSWLAGLCLCARLAFAEAPPQRFAPSPSPVPDGHERLKASLAALARTAKEDAAKLDDCPALAVGLVTGGELTWFGGYGARRPGESPEAPTKDTVFRIGSITKTFTGAALLALRDDGKLSLDDPLVRTVPEAAGLIYPTRDSAPVTLRQLATHTSGLPRVGTFDYARADAKVTSEVVLASLDGALLESPPGTRESYSNLGAAVLGLALGRVAGLSYRELVRTRLLAPLGMASAAWDREEVPPERLAAGYERRDGKLAATPHWRLGASEAAGGLYLSTADLARWAAFQMAAWPPRDDADPGPLRRSSLRESQRAAAPLTPGSHQLGIFWQLDQDPVFGTVVWHNGNVGNYRSSLFMLPQRRIAAVALCSGGEERLDAFTRDFLMNALRLDRPPLGAAMQKALAEVRAQLVKPDVRAIARLFGAKFQKVSPPEQMRVFFAAVHDHAGSCPEGELLAGDGETSAKWRLRCDKGLRDLLIHLDAADELRIDGLFIRPPADP